MPRFCKVGSYYNGSGHLPQPQKAKFVHGRFKGKTRPILLTGKQPKRAIQHKPIN